MNESCVQNDSKSKNPAWLLEYAHNETSQHGEDGIVARILETIGRLDNWCVEFGSWDGMVCSNTYSLITKKNYSAVLIEGEKGRYKDLVRNFRENKKVICLNKFVGFDADNSLDAILADTPIPQNFDLLSIDIDGNDYHVWDAFCRYKPKVVIIEFNPTIPKVVDFVQPRDMSVGQGSSILSINKLAVSKGYELVACTQCNGIFVDKTCFPLFGIADNSLDRLLPQQPMVTHLFCGVDGTVFIRGYGKSPWQQIPFNEEKMQLLPRWARKRYGDKNFIRRKLGKLYRRWRKEKFSGDNPSSGII